MTTLENAKSTADAYFDELRATAEIRQVYHDLIVQNSQAIFQTFSYSRELKQRLTEALKLKTTDESALFRGLLVQAVGVFDEFIRYLVVHGVERKKLSASKFEELDVVLRNGFLSHSGRVLAYYGSGSVNGVKYDFSKLTNSLAVCLSDSGDYFIEPRVFTILMGNSTPDRIEKVFALIGLPAPFGPELGEYADLKKVLGETRKAQVAKMAFERLAKLINLRNDIAHGELTVSISVDEFNENIDFLTALTGALDDICQKQLRG